MHTRAMTPLFSEAGQACLQQFLQPGVLCVFDFDGTLAPIVAQPDQAALPAPVRASLLQLQRRTPVAILTGRAVADAAARLAFTPDYLVGNHGLEGLPDSEARRADFVDQCAGWRRAIDAALADRLRFDPAIAVEDKTVSLSLHYRHASDQAASAAALECLFGSLTPPPRVIAGKCVFNLLPAQAGDKGTAFTALLQLSGARRALYVGDDVTDEDVFRLRRDDLLSIRIGAAPDSAARFFLEQYEAMPALLEHMVSRLTMADATQPQPDATMHDQHSGDPHG